MKVNPKSSDYIFIWEDNEEIMDGDLHCIDMYYYYKDLSNL